MTCTVCRDNENLDAASESVMDDEIVLNKQFAEVDLLLQNSSPILLLTYSPLLLTFPRVLLAACDYLYQPAVRSREWPCADVAGEPPNHLYLL